MPQKKRWHHYWCLNSRARGGLPPWASFLEFKNCSAATAKSLQSCLTLCDPIDGSPPGSTVPRILQARTPEWVAISLSNAWKWKVKVKLLSCVWLFATPWTAAHQAPPSMGFSRQEYWSGVPLPSPKNCSRLANTFLSIAANWYFFSPFKSDLSFARKYCFYFHSHWQTQLVWAVRASKNLLQRFKLYENVRQLE